jgi:hypothetical protein
MVGFIPPAFHSRARMPPYRLFRSLSVLQSCSRRCGEEKVCLRLPGIETPSLCPPDCSLVTITNELARFLFKHTISEAGCVSIIRFLPGGKVCGHLGLLKMAGFYYSLSLMCGLSRKLFFRPRVGGNRYSFRNFVFEINS